MPSIRIPFQINESGSVSSVSSVEKIIEQKVIDVLTTARYERTMRPDYGSGIYNLLFEPMDELVYGEFKTDAIDELNRNITNATIVDVGVAPASQPFFDEETASTLNVTVRYSTSLRGVRSFSFQVTDTSLLTEESNI